MQDETSQNPREEDERAQKAVLGLLLRPSEQRPWSLDEGEREVGEALAVARRHRCVARCRFDPPLRRFRVRQLRRAVYGSAVALGNTQDGRAGSLLVAALSRGRWAVRRTPPSVPSTVVNAPKQPAVAGFTGKFQNCLAVLAFSRMLL